MGLDSFHSIYGLYHTEKTNIDTCEMCRKSYIFSNVFLIDRWIKLNLKINAGAACRQPDERCTRSVWSNKQHKVTQHQPDTDGVHWIRMKISYFCFFIGIFESDSFRGQILSCEEMKCEMILGINLGHVVLVCLSQSDCAYVCLIKAPGQLNNNILIKYYCIGHIL